MMKHSKILGLLGQTLKVLMINTIIFSLIQIPFISKGYAQEKIGISDVVNLGLNTYKNYRQQLLNARKSEIDKANEEKLKSQMSPTCMKADRSYCYAGPAKYFPECTLPASMSNMPTNVCSNSTTKEGQIKSMITYEAIAEGWKNYYDQMTNEAANSSYTVGLRCLKDKQKALDSQLTEMVNNLQRMQDKLNQEKQIFRDNNKKLLEDMNATNDELFGASKNNLGMKTMDFAKFFSQSCQSVIGKDNLNSGKEKGLNGILQGLSSTNKSAADFNLNKNVIEKEVREEANKIASSIKSGGIEDYLNNRANPAGSKSNYKSIEAALKKQEGEFGIAVKRIVKELAAVGYTPPPMDQNFSTDMEEFLAGSADFFKKKYVNDCVTGADKGVAIPVEDVLANVQQKSTRNQGTARNDYRVALKKILDSEAMMDEKMVAIKSLQAQYPDITIDYKTGTGQRITSSPYDLFMQTIQKCEARYAQDEQFSSKGSNGVSVKKKVERGRVALQELKNLNDGFSSKIIQEITNKVLNCNGEAPKAGSCSEASLETSSENFCMAHASTCANSIQGCYAEANTHVQARKAKMETLAKRYNANVAVMIDRSNALFEQQKAAVTNITKIIQAKFPGTNFPIPNDMFVSMPEMSKNAYGVEMAGDGNLSSFLEGPNSMPEKIEKLKKMFNDQKAAVKSETDEYINLQKEAMNRERARWDKLSSDCKSKIDASFKAVADHDNKGMKDQVEMDILVEKYCEKYSDIRDNPNGGCDKAESLVETWAKIQEKGGSGRIFAQTRALSEQYNSACNALNNETSTESWPDYCTKEKAIKERSDKDAAHCASLVAAQAKKRDASEPSQKAPLFSDLCETTETKNEDFIKNALANLPKSEADKVTKFDEIANAILTPGTSFPSYYGKDFKDNGFFKHLKSMIASSGDGGICNRIMNKHINKKIAGKNSEIKKVNEELTKINDQIKEIDNITDATEKEKKKDKRQSLEDSKNEKKGKITELEEEVKQINTESSPADIAELKVGGRNILEELISAPELPDPASMTGMKSRLESVGEKIEKQTACDAQNNNSMAKGSMDIDTKAFDQSILGINR